MTSRMYDIFARMIQVLTAFPSRTRRGLVALFNLTGRLWLFLHDATVWYGLYGFGACIVFVDGTSGTDSPEKGTGAGTAAYRTLQYAVDQLPAGLFGNVTFNVAAGTYREQVTVRGKQFYGDFAMTFLGVVSELVASTSATAGANGAGNGSAGYGTLTKAAAGWTVNAYQNRWVEVLTGTGAGQIRVIHSNTATVLTIVGRWDTPPDATSTFRIWNLGTRVTGSNAGADTTPVRDYAFLVTNQRSVLLDRLRLDYCTQANLGVLQYSSCDAIYCDLSNGSGFGVLYRDYSYSTYLDRCTILENLYGLVVRYSATVTLLTMSRVVSASGVAGLYVDGGRLAAVSLGYVSAIGAGAIQFQLINASQGTSDGYMEYEGSTVVPTSHNILVDSGSKLYAVQNQGAFATQRVLNAGGWGVFASSTGEMYDASGLTYSGNVSGTRTPATGLAGGTT